VTAYDSASEMRRHSSLVAAGIALSRVTGVLRDAVLAFFLGANLGADAFRAALRIPNLLQNLLGEGVLSASFIPTYSRLLAEGRERDAGRVAGAVAGLLTVVVGVLVVLGVVLARPITSLLTPGFTGERLELTITLVRVMFPGIGVLVLSAWCLGILNSHRRFFLSYVAPVLWNAGIVATLVALGATGVLDPAVAAGVGVVVGGTLQLAIQVPSVVRLMRSSFVPSLDTRSPGVRQVLGAFGPIVAGRGVVQIAALVDLVLASLLAVGAVAVLGYAQSLYLLPIALFGMSVAAAELPSLSSMGADDRAALAGRLDAGLARSAFFVVGGTVGYILVGDLIVQVLFGRGEFDPATAVQVALVLAVYSIGLVPTTASRLLQSVLYATGDPRTPAVVAAVRVGAALAIALPLMFTLDQIQVQVVVGERFGLRLADGAVLPRFTPADETLRDVATNQLRLGAVGLAAGAAVASWLEYWLLRRTIARRYTAPRLGGGTLGRLATAAGGAVAVIVAARVLLPEVPALVELAVAGGAGAATYLGITLAVAVPEARALLSPPRRPGHRP
jgi:putative peptidoglycan lipid II flippase